LLTLLCFPAAAELPLKLPVAGTLPQGQAAHRGAAPRLASGPNMAGRPRQGALPLPSHRLPAAVHSGDRS